MSQYILQSLNIKSNVVDKKSLAESGKTSVKAQAGVQYQLIDQSTGKTPKKQVLKKKGKNLIVEVDGAEVAEIQGFYDGSAGKDTPSVRMDDLCSLDDPKSLQQSNKEGKYELVVGGTAEGSANAAGDGIVWHEDAAKCIVPPVDPIVASSVIGGLSQAQMFAVGLGGLALGALAVGGSGGGSSGNGSGSNPGGGNNPGGSTPTPDTTPPAAPVGTFNNSDPANPVMNGTGGEPGATIVIKDSNGQVIGSAVVNPDGTWSVPLDPTALVDGDTLTINQIDPAGNISPPANALVDLQPPSAPVGTLDNSDPLNPVMNGTGGEPGSTITVTDGYGNVIGSAVVNPDGTWSVPIDPSGLVDGDTLDITQTDPADNVGPSLNIPFDLTPTITLDPIAIDGIVNLSESNAAVAITGITTNTAAGDTVTLVINGVTYTGVVAADLSFTMNVAGADLLADADLSIDASVVSGTLTGSSTQSYTIDTTAPTTTVTITTISTDSGTAGDFITNDNNGLTVNATLSTALVAGEKLMYSHDNGATWTDITSSVSGTAVSYADSGLTSSNTVKFQVVDTAGNAGATASQAITIDATAPTTTVTITTISTDSGTAGDFITNDNNGLTVNATLSTALVAGEKLMYSHDNGATWTDITSSVSGTAVSYADSGLTSSNTVKFQVVDTAGNAGATASQAITIDTTAPTTTVTITTISTDSGTAGDFITNDNNGLTVNATLSTALVAGEKLMYSHDNGATWTDITSSVSGTAVSYADSGLTSSNTVKFQVVDTAGNAGATASQAITIDTTPPTITLSTIAGDDVVNASEKAAGVLVSGTTTAQAGQTVTVVWGSTTHTATVTSSGTWSVAFSGSELPADGSTTVTASVSDIAGNAATPASRPVDVLTAGIAIVIDTLLGDNILNASERTSIDTANTWAVTGTTTAAVGSTVTLLINQKTYTGTVAAGGTWSINVVDTDVLALAHGNTYAIKATVTEVSGNTASGSSNLQVLIAPPDIPTVNLQNTNSYTPTITGLAALDSGGTAIALGTGDQFTVTAGGQSYTYIVGTTNSGPLSYNAATQTWTLVLPAGVITADGIYNVGVSVSAVGYTSPKTDISSNELVISKSMPTLVVNTIAGDDIINATEIQGALTISGSVTDLVPGTLTNAAIGGTVSFTLDGQTYTAVVKSDGTWSALVPITAVGALSGTETVAATFTSIYNNSASANHNVVVDTTAPTTTVTITTISTDSGTAGDFITNDNNGLTVNATLSTALVAGEKLMYSHDNGATWTDITSSVSGTAVSYADSGLTSSNTVKFQVIDTAGNAGATASQAITIDTTAPTTTVTITTISTDSGTAGDFITNDNNGLTVNATLSTALVAGEKLMYSHDNGATWTDITSSVSGTAVSYADSGLTSSNTVKFQVIDTAGNAGATASQAITIDATAPTTTVTITTISTDSGTAGDFITNDNNGLTVNATLSTALVAGEKLMYSHDNGATWTDITSSVSGTAVSYADSGLTSSNTVKFQVIDTAGNAGATASQAITIDATAPTTTVTITTISTDSGTAGDFITNDNNGLTVNATLSTALVAGEKLMYSHDNGATWTDITSSVSGTAVSYADSGLTSSNTVKFQVVDTAGNAGATASQAITIDATAPTTTVTIDSISLDDGTAGDFVTTDNDGLTVNATLSASLSAGEKLMYSNDNGATWTDITSSVSGTAVTHVDGLLISTSTVKMYVLDIADNAGAQASQLITIQLGPTTTVTISSISDDSGTAGDFITNDNNGLTIVGTLSAALAAGEQLQYSRDGINWFDITSSVTGTAISYQDLSLVSTSTIKMRVTDAAGINGTVTSQLITIDTVAPTAPSLALDMTSATDLGNSSSDDITKDSTPDFTVGSLPAGVVAIKLLVDGVEVASTYSGGVLTPTSALSEGAHNISYVYVDATGNISSASPSLPITIDTTPPTITLSTIAGDDVVNASEKAAGVLVSGTTTAQAGQTVTVVWGSTTHTATVTSSGTWSVAFSGSELPADGSTTVTASVSDIAGNAATPASRPVDVLTAGVAIVIDTLLGDNILNASERTSIDTANTWAVTGTTTAAVGSTVTLLINQKTYTGTVAAGGTWSINVVDTDVLALAHGNTYAIKATVTEVSGNTASGSSNLQVLIAPPDIPTVNLQNTNSYTPTITGLAALDSGGTAIALGTGDQFTVTAGGQSYTYIVGTTNSGPLSYNAATQTWTLVLPAGVITADGIYNVGVSVSAVGYTSPKTDISSNELVISKSVPTLVVNTIAGDDIINATEIQGALTISGSVTDLVPGTLTNAAIGGTVSFTLDGQTYTAVVKSDGTWSALVPITAVGALSGTETVAATFTSIYNNSASANHNVVVDALPPVFTNTIPADVIENSGSGQIIYTAQASDVVQFTNGAIVYTLSGVDAGLFSINSNTGAVTLSSNPDFESKSSYSFNVVATDQAGNSTVKPLTLTVQDQVIRLTDGKLDDSYLNIDEVGQLNGSDSINFAMIGDATNFTDGSVVDITLRDSAGHTRTAQATMQGGAWSTDAVFDIDSVPGAAFVDGLVTVTAVSGNESTSSVVTLDRVRPELVDFTATTSALPAIYFEGQGIEIVATLTEVVAAGSSFTVTLNTGATIILTAATNSNRLTGIYVPENGEYTENLQVAWVDSQNIFDLAGNEMMNIVGTDIGTNNILASDTTKSIEIAPRVQGTTAGDMIIAYSVDAPVAGWDSVGDAQTLDAISYLGGRIYDGSPTVSGINGSDGSDTISYEMDSVALRIDLAANSAYGMTTVPGRTGYDTLYSIENVIGGSGNDTIIGNSLANVLDGGDGSDSVFGGDGNDTLISWQAGTDARLDGGNGIDWVDFSGKADTDGNPVSISAVIGSTSISLIENALGTDLGDSLIAVASGSTVDNYFIGGAGSDTLRGYAGDDTLDGGDGENIIEAGIGNDWVIAGEDSDSITDGAGDDTVDAGAGNDLINLTAARVTIAADGNDSYNGGEGDDQIYGGAGNDTLMGGQGFDWLHGGADIDWANYSDQTSDMNIILSQYVDANEDGSLTGTETIPVGIAENADGEQDTLTQIENIYAGDGNDLMRGDSLANQLWGNNGNDTLGGGLGNVGDTMVGGAGVDWVDYSDLAASLGGVTVNLETGIVSGAAGADSVSQIENIQGSQGKDLLTAANAGSVILGLAGGDTIVGGTGNDTLVGGEPAYLSTDSVIVVDGESVTIEMITGVEGDSIYGNAGNDMIVMADGATVDGGTGNDTIAVEGDQDWAITSIAGGAGNDLVFLQTANDTIEFYMDSVLLDTDGSVVDNVFRAANADGIDTIDIGDANNRLDLTRFESIDEMTAVESITDSTTASLYIKGASGTVALPPGFSCTHLETVSGGITWEIYTNSALSGDDTVYVQKELNVLSVAMLTPNPDNYPIGFTSQIPAGHSCPSWDASLDNVIWALSSADTVFAGAGNDTVRGDGAIPGQTAVPAADYLDGETNTAISLGGGDWVDYSYITLPTNATTAQKISVGTRIDLSSNRATAETFVDTIVNFEHAKGGAGNDVIIGDTQTNWLSGWKGNDTLTGGGGNDTLEGGIGADVLIGGSSTLDSTVNGAGDWAFYGNAAGRVVVNLTTGRASGYEGNDTLYGIENVFGGRGNDLLIGSSLANILMGGAGRDQLYGAAGNDTLLGGAGHDVLDGGAGNDYFMGEAGNDFYIGGTGTGIDVLDLSADSLGIVSGVSNSYYRMMTIQSAFGTDRYSAWNSKYYIENFKLGSGNDTWLGGTFIAETIDGGAGNDIIRGMGGNDSINGGIGNDTLLGGTGGDILNGGAGIDWADYATNQSNQPISVNMVTGTGSDTLQGIENVRAGAGNDSIFADSLDNYIIGNGGSDTLNGNGGNDTIDGGLGNDYVFMNAGDGNDLIMGGTGRDTLDLSGFSSITGVALDLSTGISTGGYGTDTISGFEFIRGSNGADTIIGSAANETIVGDLSAVATVGGADLLNGGAGNDSLFGGQGNDTLVGGTGNDTLNGGAGTLDWADYSYAGSAIKVLADYITVTGGGDIDRRQNLEAIYGSAYNDTISGNRSLAEYLKGGAGNDVMYAGGSALTSLYSSARDTIDAGDGNDTVFGQYYYTGATGAYIIGDTLIGGAGTDWLDYGSTYNLNTYGVTADLTAGRGVKSVNINGVSNGGYSATDTISGFENVAGTAARDSLRGDAGANILDGRAGNDSLNGEGGNDTLIGGVGNDTIIAQNADGNDIVFGDAGIDVATYQFVNAAITLNMVGSDATVQSSSSGTDVLHAVEWFVGSSLSDVMLGDTLADRFDGGTGNDSLGGGIGADSLVGGLGSDTLMGGRGSDLIYGDLYNAAATDSAVSRDWADYSDLTSSDSLMLSLYSGRATVNSAAEVDTLAFIDAVIGGAGNDSIQGNSSANVLLGGAGNDTLNGGGTGSLDNDSLDGGSGIDWVDYSTYNGNVAHSTTITVNLVTGIASGTGFGTDTLSNIENIKTGGGADTITAQANIDNYIVSGAGSDSIMTDGAANDTAGTGADTVRSGSGSDIVWLGGGNDVFVFDSAYSADTLVDTVRGGDGFDAIVFDGSALTMDLTATRFGDVNLESFERINLTGSGNNSIKLAAADIMDLTDRAASLATLILDGNAGDKATLNGIAAGDLASGTVFVDLNGDGISGAGETFVVNAGGLVTGDFGNGSQTYIAYKNATWGTILVDNDISITGIV